jgi:hypothetical protein
MRPACQLASLPSIRFCILPKRKRRSTDTSKGALVDGGYHFCSRAYRQIPAFLESPFFLGHFRISWALYKVCTSRFPRKGYASLIGRREVHLVNSRHKENSPSGSAFLCIFVTLKTVDRILHRCTERPDGCYRTSCQSLGVVLSSSCPLTRDCTKKQILHIYIETHLQQ